MEETYKNPALPGSFGGINALKRVLKGRARTSEIRKWLQSKESYTLHKPLRHKIQKNRVIVGGLNEQFQADLVDMQAYSLENDGFKYLLV